MNAAWRVMKAAGEWTKVSCDVCAVLKKTKRIA
jgi:hypothetical protein